MRTPIVSIVLGTAMCLQTVQAQTAVEPLEDTYDPLKDCEVMIIDEVSVPAPEPGVIEELTVREGDFVEKGQVLARIDKKDAMLAISIAQAEYDSARKRADNTLSIEAAQKSYEVAKAEFESAQEANRISKDTVTETELRRKRLQMTRALLQIKLAAHEVRVAVLDAHAKHKALKLAEASLERREIKSTINGIVVRLDKHAGDWASPGETLMRVVRLDQLRIEGDINGQIHARHDIINRPVTVTVTLTGGKEFRTEGTIDFAGVEVERNEYTVRVDIDNKKVNGVWLLTPGLDARIELQNELTGFQSLGAR